MARLTAGKRAELESFWRSHLEGWRRSDLNQREYCELHGLPLKRFGNWRARFKHEDDVPREALLWRRGGGLKHMPEHMRKEVPPAPSGYIPSARSVGRRNFSEADKRRIVEEGTVRLNIWSYYDRRMVVGVCRFSVPFTDSPKTQYQPNCR